MVEDKISLLLWYLTDRLLLRLMSLMLDTGKKIR